MGFRLADNAFAVLGASMRANTSEMVSAYQDAVLDGVHDEAVLAKAKATLTNPRERLRAEVSFLPNSNPREARAILAKLQVDNDGSIEGNGMLDTANLLADALDRQRDPSILIDLVINIAEIDTAAVVADINAARQVSNVRAADHEAVSEALAWLIARHAEVGAKAAANGLPGADAAENAVEFGLESPGAMSFLAAFIPAYARQTAPTLSKLEAEMADLDVKLRAKPGQARAEELAETLALWDRYRQPVQLWDEAQGIDEPESKALGERLRALCLYLANDLDAYDTALIISKALRDCFGELAGLRDLFLRDVDQLEDLSRSAQTDTVLRPLRELVAALTADLPRTARSLGASSIGAAEGGNLRQLHKTFMQALSSLEPSDDVALPFFEVRNLALALHNDGKFTSEAMSVTRWLQSHQHRAPAVVTEKLAEDAAALQHSLTQAELAQAIKRKDLSTAHQLAMDLARKSDDPKARVDWLTLSNTLFEKQEEKRGAWKNWAAYLGVFFLFLFIKACITDQPTSTYSATTTTEAPAYDASTPLATDDAALTTDAGAAATEAAGEGVAAAAATDGAAATDVNGSISTPPTDSSETPLVTAEVPAVGSGQALTRAELRYCQEQNVRLKTAEILVDNASNSQVRSYNNAIGEYNSRCGNYMYRDSDMQAVKREIEDRRMNLTNEGRLLAEGWQ